MAGTKGRSARGAKVDFDSMKIKQQLADAPKAIEVTQREEMITTKRKRKKAKPTPVPVVEDVEVADEEKE